MRKKIAIIALLTFSSTGCSDTEILDVASTIATSNALGETQTVYARIARSARACWFKPGGLIKNTHMFYAEAQPQAQGGRAELSIRLRRQDGRPGDKAYLVSLVPAGTNTLYATRNITLAEKTAGKLTRDVKRWANAELGCNPSHKREWAPEAPKQSNKKTN